MAAIRKRSSSRNPLSCASGMRRRIWRALRPCSVPSITTFSPLRHWGAGPGKKVGVVGLGELGHMGVKIAHAMGAHVVLFTTSASKVADGKRLGADEVCISTDPDAMAHYAGRLDFILNTVAAPHNLDAYLQLLTGRHDDARRRPGQAASLAECLRVDIKAPQHCRFPHRRHSQRQEMLDFCAEHGLVSDIELIPMHYINSAYERMLKSDVRYRFVIEMASL